MTSLWDLTEEKRNELENLGVDYDLSACLENNPQSFDILDIEKVLAVWEGENDGEDWRWVIKVTPECAKKNGGRYVFLQGGCDYTGWDCRSWATSDFKSTALKASKKALGDIQLNDSSPMDAGLGHMLSLLSGGYGNNFQEVYENLVSQIKSKKNKTWREEKNKEFNTKDLPKL